MSNASQPTQNRGKFQISVMGNKIEFQIVEGLELAKPSNEALERTKNNPDLTKWVLKNSTGTDLSFSETEGKAGIKNGDVLYLSPKTGAGGNEASS
jgi:hypothetical protein